MANLNRLLRIMAPLAALCAVLAGCAVGGTTTTAASTTPTASPTATPIPCATRATTTGVVWSQASDKQIHGGIGGAAPGALSSFAYPLTPTEPGYVDGGPAQISLAPDGKHMAVLQSQYLPNTDAPQQYILFSVDTTTHAATHIANVGTRADLAGWADTKTLLYFQSPFWPSHVATENLHFYDIAAHADSTISGVKGVAKAQVRCSTLYWSEYTPATGIGKQKLHRHNLTTHTEIGTPIDLGKAFRLPSEFAGPDSITGGGDWDVSADNTTLVWQRLDTVTVASSGDAVIGASTYQKAAADGSGAVTILAGAPAAARTHVASLALSPTATQVALAAEGVMVSGGIAGGATRSYTPTSTFTAAPVWLPDGSGFLTDIFTGSATNIYQYNVSGGLAGAVVHANSSNADALP
ncbi:MAG TPA: hypothetical protein VH349_08755 [Ktedonobacterales bacterium]|jgi:hypothetical protein